MVTSLWNKIRVYCDLHETPVKMELVCHNGVTYYECPYSHSENLKDNSPICKSVLPLKDFEKMLDHISRILFEAEMNNEVPNLKNTDFTIGKFRYHIFDHKEKIRVIARDIRIKKEIPLKGDGNAKK